MLPLCRDSAVFGGVFVVVCECVCQRDKQRRDGALAAASSASNADQHASAPSAVVTSSAAVRSNAVVRSSAVVRSCTVVRSCAMLGGREGTRRHNVEQRKVNASELIEVNKYHFKQPTRLDLQCTHAPPRKDEKCTLRVSVRENALSMQQPPITHASTQAITRDSACMHKQESYRMVVEWFGRIV
jgi:hypothetical protein